SSSRYIPACFNRENDEDSPNTMITLSNVSKTPPTHAAPTQSPTPAMAAAQPTLPMPEVPVSKHIQKPSQRILDILEGSGNVNWHGERN
ncbi:hypothetical protein BDN67DRAFT_1017012, partial [Paxillus ammoniavirescens]